MLQLINITFGHLRFETPLKTSTGKTAFNVLAAIAFAHFFNDLLQAVVPAIYPMLQQRYQLSMTQIGIITFCFQLSASILQPIVGAYTDKHPKPFSQVIGMTFTGLGIALLAYAPNYIWILVSVTLIGIGSSIFHPESARVAFAASGGKRSLAQAIFQIGGNTGSAFAPLLVAWIILPNEQQYIVWFLSAVVLAQLILIYVGTWYRRILEIRRRSVKKKYQLPGLNKVQVNWSIFILLVLIFSKYFYTAGITSYFHFYTMSKFGLSEVQAQVYLFYFLFAAALGTLLGGFFGDRFGRKYVIWFSILGAAPFTLMLPYVGLQATGILIVLIGLIISSAFPAILVYAQELMPKKIGTVSGLFYGFAFGMGGLGSAVLGYIADLSSIEYVYKICSYLPLIGLIAVFLPDLKKT